MADSEDEGEEKMQLRELEIILRKCWSRATTHDPLYWSHKNPSAGQCLVTSLIVQDFFGGEILSAGMEFKTGRENYVEYHFWNRLPDGREIDFTRNQFPKGTIIPKGEPESESSLLDNDYTRYRYNLLRARVMREIRKQKRS